MSSADVNNLASPQICRSPVGGWCQTFISNLPTTSVKGTAVMASSSVYNGVDIYKAGPTVTDRQTIIGFVCEDGVAPGKPVRIATMGKALVLLEDGKSMNMGDIVQASLTADGRVWATANTFTNNENFVGRALQTVPSGVNVLGLIQIKWN